MTDVILFHHVLGLTNGVSALAYQLGAAGHDVTVPDLYEGRTFPTIAAGMAHATEIGMEEIMAAGEAAADELPPETVYAGFSLGAMIAHKLAQNRPGAVGALLYHHGDVPMNMFGDTWPKGVDLQIHINRGDEFYEADVVESFIDQVGENATAELFTYPGSSHLFADYTLSGYEPESAELLTERTLAFLEEH